MYYRLGSVEDEVNPGVKCPPLAVLLLRHPVAPEKAEQRKKEALPSTNTSAANLCKTVKAPSLLLLLLLRPSCKEKEKSNNKHHAGSRCRRRQKTRTGDAAMETDGEQNQQGASTNGSAASGTSSRPSPMNSMSLYERQAVQHNRRCCSLSPTATGKRHVVGSTSSWRPIRQLGQNLGLLLPLASPPQSWQCPVGEGGVVGRGVGLKALQSPQEAPPLAQVSQVHPQANQSSGQNQNGPLASSAASSQSPTVSSPPSSLSRSTLSLPLATEEQRGVSAGVTTNGDSLGNQTPQGKQMTVSLKRKSDSNSANDEDGPSPPRIQPVRDHTSVLTTNPTEA
ncbi:polyhomeotic-like protein 1 isoform X1, partial [Lates japonicus]